MLLFRYLRRLASVLPLPPQLLLRPRQQRRQVIRKGQRPLQLLQPMLRQMQRLRQLQLAALLLRSTSYRAASCACAALCCTRTWSRA